MPHIKNTVKPLLENLGYTVEHHNNIVLGVNANGDNILVVHPFWSEEYINDLIKSVDSDVSIINIIDLIHNTTL
jgi:GTP cyclohydrolase III